MTADGGKWRAVLYLQLANFISLRRRLGTQGAQGLLNALAQRAASTVINAQVCVTGSDVIELRTWSAEPISLEAVAATLRSMLSCLVDSPEAAGPVDIIIGGAVNSDTEGSELPLVEAAEQASIEARAARRDVLLDLTVGSSASEGSDLTGDLLAAVARDEFFLQYQPKLHVRQQRVTGVEALIRWQHPSRGLIQPNDFIALAERSHAIADMTLWTMRRVIADQQKLSAAGHDLRVFINISGVLLTDAEFVREACALIAATDAKLGFEITETSVISDPDSAIANLNIFTRSGVTVAIDDYGAGLSSLAYLKQLPAKELKIDKMFVTQLTSSHRDPLIVRSTIDLAHALEMEVVAEGVETPAAFALLSVMGCDMIQGFLISKPVSLDLLLAFLADKERHSFAQPRPTLARFSGERKAG